MKLNRWAIGALVLGLSLGYALAQTVYTLNLTGNEAVLFQAGGVGGSSGVTTTAVLRNSTGYQLQGGGTTINTSANNLVARLIATGAITTWNITPPNPAFDGESFEVTCPGGTASTVVLSPTAGSGVNMVGAGFTGCTSGGAAANTYEGTYSTSANAWYRNQ